MQGGWGGELTARLGLGWVGLGYTLSQSVARVCLHGARAGREGREDIEREASTRASIYIYLLF